MRGSRVKRILLRAALAALAAGWGAAAPAGSQSQPPSDPLPRTERPLVIGHRGAAGRFPENTLAGFAGACALGLDAVELDVLVSADDELVVHHDFRLNPDIARTADGAWIDSASPPAIRELPLGRLKTFDIGRLRPNSAYARRYPDQVPADGERIPTLREAIDLFKKSCRPPARLLVEIKTSPEAPELTPPPEWVAEQVVRTLKKEGVAERAWVLSFDWRTLAHIQKIAPEMATVHLTIVGPGLNNMKPLQPGPSPWLSGIDVDDFGGSAPRAVKAAGGRIWSPHFRNLSPESLAEARQLGLIVSVWTPDSPDDLKTLIEWQLDAITTNRPDILKRLLEAK